MNKFLLKITSIVVLLLIFYINAALCDGYLITHSSAEKGANAYTERILPAQNHLVSMNSMQSFHFCTCHSNNLTLYNHIFSFSPLFRITFSMLPLTTLPYSQFVQPIYHPPQKPAIA